MKNRNDLKKDIHLKLYKSVKRIRMVEEVIAGRYAEQEMRCPVHLSVGQEAVPAALGVALDCDDLCVSTHRSHGHYLGKGGDLNAMIAELYGRETGCASGRGGSMHLIDQSVGFMGSTAIVSGTIPVGVGLGLSLKLKKSDRICVVFLGEGATEEGVFYESVNFAALKKLPVLFVCENNLYSVYTPLDARQPPERELCKLASSMGIESSSADGNDTVGAYQKIHEAADFIRAGKGPYFLEFFTYRWREHCGPNYDNDIGYRTETEFLAWQQKDPLVRIENELIDKKIIETIKTRQIEADIQKEIDQAFEFALASPFPKPEHLNRYIYKEERR